MAKSFELAKKVDARTRDIITGFIREAQNLLPFQENSYYNIPSSVSMITTLYYFNPEHFTLHGKLMKLNDETDAVEGLPGLRGAMIECSVYGHIVITKQDRGKFIWRFKIIDPDDEVVIIIGLDSSQKEFVNSRFDGSVGNRNKASYYGYKSHYEYYASDSSDDNNDDEGGYRVINRKDLNNQRWWKNGYNKSYGCYYSIATSEVQMELNMDGFSKTIKYYVNGKDQGIAFDNICFDNNQQYTMCVSFDEPMSVQLLEFKLIMS